VSAGLGLFKGSMNSLQNTTNSVGAIWVLESTFPLELFFITHVCSVILHEDIILSISSIYYIILYYILLYSSFIGILKSFSEEK
jgi:hypothetical protein